jgi:hypothetical protein
MMRMCRTAALALSCALVLLAGCACPRSVTRPFSPDRDAFAFANELRWKYRFDGSGGVETQKSEPPPEYSLRCFSMVRAAREFFYHARFAPELPRASRAEYERLIREVVARNSRCPSNEKDRIVIPGFANLREFSAEYADLLKSRCGGAWQSFFQRGNWRMVFPVTRGQQERTAERIAAELSQGKLPAVHVYRFPNTSLNHALLAFSAEQTSQEIRFQLYDPNDPSRPAELRFDRCARTFLFERNQYFGGGPVRVYEVYRGLFY